MRKFLIGVGALLTIAVILVGVPVALIGVAGNPLPTSTQFHNTVTLVPDYGNVILLTKILPCLAWIAWILFAIPVLIEISAGIVGQKTTKRIWLLKGQQQFAASLVAAVLMMFAAFGAAHIAAPPLAVATPRAPIATVLMTFDAAPPMTPVSESTAAPASATVSASQSPRTQTVTHLMVPGDNLWETSVKYYGVGTRDLDIFRASTGAVRADGGQLSNPNFIRPGWLLTVPDAPLVPTPPVRAPDPNPEPSAEIPVHHPSEHADLESPSEQSPEPTPGSAAGAFPSPTSTSLPQPAKGIMFHSDFAVPLSTAGGIGGLLAAGLLLALGQRRLNQRRRRRAGERIAMPDPAAADFEQELRMVANPLGLADIDNAMRLLQICAENTETILPELLAVRLVEEEISLYLMRPADLPAPFEPLTSERTVWTLRPGTVKTPSRATVSPYPALAIIGLDDHDGVLLLDLEQLGVLNVLGDEHIANGMLNALAGELAGNPWGEQIQVTLVGMPLTLARNIDRYRIQHVDEVATLLRDLQIDLDERAAALSSYGVDDVHAARTLAAVTESWAPHIVLLAKTPEEPQRRELAELVVAARRLGIAVIARGQIDASCAIIQLGSSGRAELILPGGAMPPLPFTPQLLYGRELERLEHLFKTTENDPTRPDPIERAVAQPHEASTLTMLPELDPVPVAVALPDGFASPDRWRQSEAERNDNFDLQSEKNNSAESPTPYIRFLGPVEAVGLNPREPMPGRGVELIAFLLLRNGPVDGLQLQRAFWPDTPDAANNQRGLAKKVRIAFGRTGTGELLLPENVNHHGYLLHPSVRSDWDDFRALVGDNPTLTGTDNLIAALRLVRGTPFAGCNTRRWWQWIAIPQEEMIAAIMDASDELGNRALEDRNAPLARYAARIEQAVDPLNEAGWRIELRAALQTGKTDDFHTVLDDLYTRVGGHDPDYEVDANTQTLIDQAHQRVHT